MKLEDVRIAHFRSVRGVKLEECGQFNIFIGKNNSGKSTLLSAIHSFYICLADGQIVSLRPPLGDAIDFTGRDDKSPIEVELRFSLTLAERDELVRSIALEAPQLKNAVDGLDPKLWLAANLSVTRHPKQFGYISKLTLMSPNEVQESRTILSVSPSSAAELHAKISNFQRAKADSEGIIEVTRNLDEDDWRRFREAGSTTVPRGYLLRRVASEVSPLVFQEFDSILRDSATYSEFKRTIQATSVRMLDEAKATSGQPLKNPVDTFSGNESELPKYIYTTLQLIAKTRVLYLSERRRPLGKEEAQRLLDLKVRRGGNEALKSIQETVHALLGVHIDAFESAAGPSGNKVAEMDVDDFLLEVNGSGIREALRLILDFEFAQPTILLVEEPEVHLHPALEIAMMRYLRQISQKCQVFISTHSTNFLDAGNMRNVYLVSKNGNTSVQLLNLEDAQGKIPKELGLRLSSLFMFDRLVFVEGPSDEAVIRELANKLDVNLAQRNVGFVRMGGVRNFTHYASEAILSFLSKRQVEMWFLLDHDEQEQKEIDRIKERLGQKASVHVLCKREIENYLLEPCAIQRLLQAKLVSAPKSQADLSVETIYKLIDACADQLKDLAIAKRVGKLLCRPLYASSDWTENIPKNGAKESIQQEIETQLQTLNKRRADVEAVFDSELSALTSRWDKFKLCIVPGTELLEKIFQQFGVHFRKETDSARLAAALAGNEIDPELQGFITQLGR